MKRHIRYGIYAIAATIVLGMPLSVNATETGAPAAQDYLDEETELLTAGVGDLFATVLTKDEYRKIAERAKGALWGYTELGICNVQENNLNVRQEPDESGKLVGKLPKNAACEIVSSEDGWAFIQSGKVEGYVKEEYLSTGYEARKKGEELASALAVSTADALNIREEPNTDAEIVTQVAAGEALDIVEIREDGWIKVYLDDEEVYVSGDFVKVKSDLATAITMTELLYGQGVSDVRVDLCQYAKQFLGNPYVWGGTSLTRGADCSGFVLSVFSKYGVSLPHSSRAQANQGASISASELKPGDLVFYAKGGTINHVAIYIGGGQVIHASSPKTGIKISAYNYRTPYKMVRILYD
ncbi:MAG: NlpC/P60 family protein [Lachnospiraceae bacterium]|nr:NlpC/P60 family protein [Lachnospiraceae bacterium]